MLLLSMPRLAANTRIRTACTTAERDASGRTRLLKPSWRAIFKEQDESASSTGTRALANAASRFSCASTNLTPRVGRSEEHTSELQSLMRISYAVFCLQKQNQKHT